jgi:EPS-associated MarR family transcriptional regulator
MHVKKGNSLEAPKGRSETALKNPVRQAQQMTKSQETHLKVLRHLEDNPSVSQRELAAALGISLGKTNYCLKALISKGMVKAKNFKNSANKRAYLYILTPKGMETKARISVKFLHRKVEEYEALRIEIEQLKTELGALGESERQ